MVELYRPLAAYHAARFHATLPGEVQLDDMNSAAVIGLMDAISKFDPARKVKFETYSAQRIRGAMVDELRAMDWVPRLARSRGTKVYDARAALSATYGRPPTEAEIGMRLRLSEASVARHGRITALASLSHKVVENDDGREMYAADMLVDESAAMPDARDEEADAFKKLIRGLSRDEQFVMTLYYVEGVTMREIGDAIGMSESRVSQIHSLALAQVKSRAAIPQSTAP